MERVLSLCLEDFFGTFPMVAAVGLNSIWRYHANDRSHRKANFSVRFNRTGFGLAEILINISNKWWQSKNGFYLVSCFLKFLILFCSNPGLNERQAKTRLFLFLNFFVFNKMSLESSDVEGIEFCLVVACRRWAVVLCNFVWFQQYCSWQGAVSNF